MSFCLHLQKGRHYTGILAYVSLAPIFGEAMMISGPCWVYLKALEIVRFPKLKNEKHFSKLYPYGSSCVKPKSLHNTLPGIQSAGVLRDLLTWEWHHCDPSGASRLTANRAGWHLGGMSTWSRFSHLVCLFSCSLFGSSSCEALVVRLLASTTGLSWSLCLRHVHEGTRPNTVMSWLCKTSLMSCLSIVGSRKISGSNVPLFPEMPCLIHVE